MGLRFEGDISIGAGIFFALVAAVWIGWVYRRETQHRRERMAVLLPVFRALSVALMLLMLTGPVLRGKANIADLSQVLVFLDASESMSLTDATMRPERKLLSGLKMGWIAPSASDSELHQASQALATLASGKLREEAVDESLQRMRRQIQLAVEALEQHDDLSEEMENDLLQPLRSLTNDLREATLTNTMAVDQLQVITASALAWSARLESQFTSQVSPAQSNESADRFDELTRWHRAQSALIDAPDAILPAIRDDHHVEVFSISSAAALTNDATAIWQPLGDEDLPTSLAPAEPNGSTTDLSRQISDKLRELPTSQQLSVVLVTDGQHNRVKGDSTSPLQLAKLLGSRGVPIYSIGMGTIDPPRDLAVLAVQTPETVFANDRVKGELLIKDNMDAGSPARIKIDIEGETVWSDTITTTSSGVRTVDFDFAIEQLIEDRLGTHGRPGATGNQAQSVSMPLPLEVSIEPITGELRQDNNMQTAHVRAITRPRKALLIDGRPRWEFRYLRNMFDRDQHWEVNHVLPRADGDDQRLERGKADGEFPSDRKELLGYDLIVLGEVPASMFREEELEWIKQFVGSRGGGLMIIDGQRGKLRSFSQTSIASLLPVRWSDVHSKGMRDTRLSLSDRGRDTSALAFDGDIEKTSVQWTQLPALGWVAPVESLPGSEVLLEATSQNSEVGGDVVVRPAMVLRRYGAGTVLYSAFDDSWRWRYEVADKYHQQYWNQIATFVMEPPYAVHDKFASLDTGGFTYQSGETAEFKVRLRDERGNPILNAKAEAILYRQGEVVAKIPLDPGATSGGVMRGNSQPLVPGNYTVGLKADGFRSEQLKLHAEFIVLGDGTGEMGVLYCDEDLLRQMAALSGGQYLREEEAGRLPELLAPYSDGKETITEIALWRSWYWFLPLVGLFSAEWFVRKRLGLI